MPIIFRYVKIYINEVLFMNEKCILDENKICNDCGECDRCDLDTEKICDNCGKCIGLDADSRAIEIEDVILRK